MNLSTLSDLLVLSILLYLSIRIFKLLPSFSLPTSASSQRDLSCENTTSTIMIDGQLDMADNKADNKHES